LAELAEILSMEIPEGLPEGPRRLAACLREDDVLARRVWSHPMYVELVAWLSKRYPQAGVAWDDMAVYALGRVASCRASVLTASTVRAGMLGTAAWVRYRGREQERLDRGEPSIESVDLVADSLVTERFAPEPTRLPSPVEYLRVALAGSLPVRAQDVVDEGWRIAHDHYVWLAGLTGLCGESLLEAGQSAPAVNRHRRLVRRLPESWPAVTRKAVVQLLAGTPRQSGLLLWWASAPAVEVPMPVRSRWRGLVAVIDPSVGGLSERQRRLVRERAQRWHPAVEAVDSFSRAV
jgi:hypothetical protein